MLYRSQYTVPLARIVLRSPKSFMECSVTKIYQPLHARRLSRPLILNRVAAGFPAPVDDYIEGRIDLNRDLLRHPFSTFYLRVTGDSMEPLIQSGALVIVDRMAETCDKNIIVARLGNELCIKRLRILDSGEILLCSENPKYEPIIIQLDEDFEIWGKVLHAIHTF